MGNETDLVVARWGRCSSGAALLNYLRPASQAGVAVIDLRELRFVEPIGLVAIAAFAVAQSEQGRVIWLRGPSEYSVANYLSRMRVGHLVEELEGEHDLDSVREHDRTEVLLELQRFEEEAGAEALAELVYNRVASDNEAVAAALHQSICEIGSNVPQHSGQRFGFVAAQTYQGGRVEFAVGDCGDGMASTLRAVATDGRDALRLALEVGVSSTGDPGRGQGIRETRRLVNDLGGSLTILSGHESRTGFAGRSTHMSGESAFPGTVLQGEVP